jgi:hypothetical protein
MTYTEPLDQFHPTVSAICQAASNHGWFIRPQDAVTLVEKVRWTIQLETQQVGPSDQGAVSLNRRLTEKIVRELLPEYLTTSEGDRPEIPDDLFEEISALMVDRGNR